MQTVISEMKPNPKAEVPSTISLGTAKIREALASWRLEHPDVPWSILLRRGILRELAAQKGKRSK